MGTRMIAVTGASGHLGQEITRLLPDPLPVGRIMPNHAVNGLIHVSAPDYRNRQAVRDFTNHLEDVKDYVQRFEIRHVVIVGSWWQYAEGNCRDLPYTKLKNLQYRMFSNRAHVIPFSIYGDEPRPGRGFIPQLVNTITTGDPLRMLSRQPRDFIHVTDVARACIMALGHSGIFEARTGIQQSPHDIAAVYRVTAPDYEEFPLADPVYKYPTVPEWSPTVDLHAHIRARIGK